MRTSIAIVLLLCALSIGAILRFENANSRAVHADEGEQASTFLNLYQNGDYAYNPDGPHGPTLYYYANAAAKPFGKTQGEITVPFLRALLTPISILILLFFVANRKKTGTAAALGACAAFSMSATAVIYSTYFVHEIIFAFSVLGFMYAVWSFVKRPCALNAAYAGAWAGLAQTTKETAIIAFAAAIPAVVAGLAADASARASLRESWGIKNALKFSLSALAAFAFIFAAFYSSFGANWQGLADAFASYIHFFDKAGNQDHGSSAWFYIELLTYLKSEGASFGEWPISVLALAGFVFAVNNAVRKKDASHAAFVIYMFTAAAAAIAILSAITYKTPWLILSPIVLLCPVAGYGAAQMIFTKRTLISILSIFVICVLGYKQYALNNNAVIRYASDPRNPFIYSHTVRDFGRLMERIEAAKKYSEFGSDIPVAFISKESVWPAPWLLRDTPNAGYWNASVPENIDIFDIIVCDAQFTPQVESLIDKSKYQSEIYGMRKNLILTVFIKKEIFNALTENN